MHYSLSQANKCTYNRHLHAEMPVKTSAHTNWGWQMCWGEGGIVFGKGLGEFSRKVNIRKYPVGGERARRMSWVILW